MSATTTPAPIPEHLSPLTLALLEDTVSSGPPIDFTFRPFSKYFQNSFQGWYKANFSIAESFAFGHGAGCDFVVSCDGINIFRNTNYNINIMECYSHLGATLYS